MTTQQTEAIDRNVEREVERLTRRFDGDAYTALSAKCFEVEIQKIKQTEEGAANGS